MTQPPPREPRRKAAVQRVEPDEDLRTVQQLLEMAGFDPGAADGIPGPATTEALRRFQEANGLRPDGVADDKTLDLLSRVTTNLPPTASKRRPAPRRTPASSDVGPPSSKRRSPLPVITGIAPPAFPAKTAVTLEIRGTGFTRDSDVHVARSGPDTLVSGETIEFLGPELLRVAMDERAFEEPGQLWIMVVNPGPGGGASAPFAVEVTGAAGVAYDRRSYLPRLAADSMEGTELLERRERIEFLASVLAATELETPLAVGLFGDWGSGKSFFMRRLQERIVTLTEASAQAQKDERPSYYCSHIRQVSFNAWLYSDSGTIWPALAAQVFRSVTGAETEAPHGYMQQEAMRAYQASEANRVRELVARREEAESEEAALERRIGELTEEIADRRTRIAERASSLGSEAAAAARAADEVRQSVTAVDRIARGWRDLRPLDLVIVGAPLVVGLAFALGLGSTRAAALAVTLGAVITLATKAIRYVDETTRLRAELRELKEAKSLLEQKRAARAEEKASAEKEVETTAELPLLRQFAEEQATRWTTRQELGVVTEIRLAFELLSRTIDESRKARASSPADESQVPIDRVIVYVDDLDRCQPDVVVRVLETLKLLLSLPNFVVVVGVDSRWLFRSLELHFRELLRSDDGRGADSAWAATPQNYLEKIFQYSVVLRPIGEAGFRSLISHLLGPRADEQRRGHGLAQQKEAGSTDADGKTTGAVQQPVDLAPAETEDRTAAAVDRTPSVAQTPELDLTPDELVVTPEELEFMLRLAPMFETPRATKRLANVYRLLRVAVGADRLRQAEGYEPVLLLLAIGIGFPGLAGDVFRAIATRSGQARPPLWPTFVNGLKPPTRSPSPAEVEAWGALVGALSRVAPAALEDRRLASFRPWIPVVAEFSFHPWQELLPSETQA